MSSVSLIQTKALRLPALSGSRPPSQQAWRLFIQSAADEVAGHTRKMLAQSISPDQWYEAMSTSLVDMHAGAHAMGRASAGVRGPLSEMDLLVGRAMMDNESEYLQGFLLDIKDGRYGEIGAEDFRTGGVAQRCKLYVGKARGTAGEAFVQNSPEEALFEWIMTAQEHCTSCPIFAENGPYEKGTIPTTPGLGDTECLGNCKCYLRRSDGVGSFKPAAFEMNL